MSASNAKKKRPAPSQPPTSTAQPNIINSLLDCYDFLATNEYSDKTIGIQAFLTRKSVGDINFSDIIDDSDKRQRQGQPTNFAGILEEKRLNLPAIDASIEKCMMLTRLIDHIKTNDANFTKLISDIRIEMQYKMVDDHNAQTSYDFGKRAEEFNKRKHAQEIRRLFYFSNADLHEPKNLVYLQNRTTQHLTYMINKMPRDSKARQPYYAELETIFRNSFMIVTQPRSGVNPVTIYERKGPGEYTAKVSVVIISLLHEFMQAYPDVIELYDIEPSLSPLSPFYKLEEPRSLSWKPYQLQTTPGGRSQTFLCAELSAITIQQSSKTDTRVRFAQLLHSFKFAIKLQLNLADSKMPPVIQFPLESLVFGIGAHNNQISQLLTRVILDDIRRFSTVQPPDVKIVQTFMLRYFIHRTGVYANECVRIYLDQELTKATNQRSNYQSLEDIYLDFLANFVHQVEFMAKHPLLAMFHADSLFLGICNSERAAEAIVQSSISGSPVIGLRFNSIRLDYNAVAAQAATTRTIKLPACQIRVDIYNDRTRKIQNRTFDSTILANDISKLVVSANTENAGHIHVLSNFDDRANGRNYSSFKEFSKYFHERLQEISKDDGRYKPITDLMDNVTNGNTDEDGSEYNARDPYGSFPFGSNSMASLASTVFETENSSDAFSVHDYESIGRASSTNSIASPQNVLSPSNRLQQQQPSPHETPYVNNQEAILKYILSQPDIAERVMRQYGVGNVSTSGEASKQTLQQSNLQYQTQPSPSQQQYAVQSPTQVTFQQPMIQPTYHQQQPQMSQQQQQAPMQFQQPPQVQFYQPGTQQQHQLPYQQQPRQTSSSVIHYLPNNTNQSSPPMQQTNEQFHFITPNDIDTMPSQFLEQINILNLTDGSLDQLAANSAQQQMTTDETPVLLDDEMILQILADLNNPKSTGTDN